MTATIIRDFRGDSAAIPFSAVDVDTGEVLDITGWPIVCEIWDGVQTPLQKATANISGGGDNQILITGAEAGEFEIYVDKDETIAFAEASNIEIAVLIGDQKDTIHQGQIKFKFPVIDWETIV